MNRTIALPALTSLVSDEEVLVRDYYRDTFGMNPKNNYKSTIASLNSVVGINASLDSKKLNVGFGKKPAEILFAVGIGALTVNPNYADNVIEKILVSSDNPTWIRPSVVSGDPLVDTVGCMIVTPICNVPVVETSPIKMSDYGVFKPSQNTESSEYFRECYAKKCRIIKDLVILDSVHNNPVKVNQVICHIAKTDLIAANVTDQVISFNELALYFGTSVILPRPRPVTPATYLTKTEPTADYIDVLPFYHLVFQDINVEDIPDSGIEFVFNIVIDDDNVIPPAP